MDSFKRNIIITGGAGFIGSHTALALLDVDEDIIIGIPHYKLG